MEQTSCDNISKNGKSDRITAAFFSTIQSNKVFFSYSLRMFTLSISTEMKYRIL